MAHWTKKAAIERMNQNALLQEALRVEPALQFILNEAINQKRVPGYDRIQAYLALKSRLVHLVGWHSSQPAIRTIQHYDAVIRTIDDLLPPDDVDLDPEGVNRTR